MGKSSSDASTKTTTTYNTSTSTTVGDIGFTGKDAIAFETAILQYNLASQQANHAALDSAVTKLSSFAAGGTVPKDAEATKATPSSGLLQNPYVLFGGLGIIALLFFMR